MFDNCSATLVIIYALYHEPYDTFQTVKVSLP
jgi:hypothetical protein